MDNSAVTRNKAAAKLVLRAYHDDEEPDAVTRELELSATRVQAPGTHSSMPGGIPLSGAWFLESDALQLTAQDGAAPLESFCGVLAARASRIRVLEDRGWTFSLVLRWPDRGFEGPQFSSEVLAQLASIGLALRVEIVDP
jgi:Domain of unknown function (DUF4279)